MLDAAFKKTLLGRAHKLHPFVTVGQKGLTENVLSEIGVALEAHELIKVKLIGEREERAEWTQTILAHFEEAELIQSIGQVIVLYQPEENDADL